MNQPDLLELAKQGDANAIATLMNRKLEPKGITAKASIKNDCLQIMLESAQVTPQETLVTLIRKSLSTLGAKCIKRVKVYGKQAKEEFLDWSEEFEVEAQTGDRVEKLDQAGDINEIEWLTVKEAFEKLGGDASDPESVISSIDGDRTVKLNRFRVLSASDYQTFGLEFRPDRRRRRLPCLRQL